MKFFLLWLTLIATLHASEPTQAVLDTFGEKYPDITAAQWELDGNGSWEAHFEKEGIKYRADFNPNGLWIETENSLTYEELPANIRAAIEIKHRAEDVRDIEAVDSATHGLFFDIELQRGAEKFDLMLDPEGRTLKAGTPPTEQGFFQQWMGLASTETPFLHTGWPLVYKVAFNLITILIFAYVIYYRRHHDHEMLFLLLAFNLFLYPIFLSSSLVTAGFGFTIFALLALVRLRSVTFSKTEISYLLGAICLTFVNTMVPTIVDVISATTILLTAFIADRPSLWRDAFQKIEVDYRMTDKELMLDQEYLRKTLAEEYQVDVREITINRVFKNEVRLTLMYRDLPELRKTKRPVIEEKAEKEEEPFHY